MSGELVLAVAFIIVVLAPIVWLIKSDMALGAIGVLSGGAVTWFLHRNQTDNWGFALVMALAAAALYVFGLIKDDDVKKVKARPYFWLSFIAGVFGALLPALLGLKQTVDPDKMTIPWGWLILVVAIVVGFLVLLARRKRT